MKYIGNITVNKKYIEDILLSVSALDYLYDDSLERMTDDFDELIIIE